MSRHDATYIRALIGRVLVSAVGFCAVGPDSAYGAVLAEDDVRGAAAAFVSANPIGKAVLGGRTVLDVSARGNLWIVRLAPSGHIVMSGSDTLDPIVSFSANDYEEPADDSPARALLASADAVAGGMEEFCGDAERNEGWERLLSLPSAGPRLRSASVGLPSTATCIVPNLLTTQWAQWQPFNDYAPVHDPSPKSNENRGRAQGGCVATAAAQMYNYFRWPARIDNVISNVHDFVYPSNVTNDFLIRFDGHVPIDWDSLQDTYMYRNVTTNYYYYPNDPQGLYRWWEVIDHDLRGVVPETVRHPIARLNLWADVLSNMTFYLRDSVATYDPEMVSEYYTRGRFLPGGSIRSVMGDLQVKSDVANGVPCQLVIQGHSKNDPNVGSAHQVVVCGWAVDGATSYAYLNFGWTKGSDGFYNVSGDLDADSEDGSSYTYTNCVALVGHYPRAKPQIDPLPKVCSSNNDVTVSWHFPDFYTNNLSGFIVQATRYINETTTNFTDFTSEPGHSSGASMSVREDSVHGIGMGNLLYTTHVVHDGEDHLIEECEYLFDGAYKLTSASVLTFDILSYSANWMTYEIQASFDGASWQTICRPPLNEAYKSGDSYYASDDPQWHSCRIFLGEHGGQAARFRILKGLVSQDYFLNPDFGKILLDNFKVTDVLVTEVLPTDFTASPEGRCMSLTGLTSGSDYSVTVTPLWTSPSALVGSETSNPIFFSVEGTRQSPDVGEETHTLRNLVFSTNDTSGVWSYVGNAVSSNGVCDVIGDSVIGGSSYRGSVCRIIADVFGLLTENSFVTFAWKSENYYQNESSYDRIATTFVDENGTLSEVEVFSNHGTRSEATWNNVPLGSYAGHSGWVIVELVHYGTYYGPGTSVLEGMEIGNVLVPETQPIQWRTQSATALGTPEIRGVTVRGKPIREGMFHECELGETEFVVECSDSVTVLEARPSHLSLVSDEDIAVEPITGSVGRFRVRILRTNVTKENERSRMILTLAATDSNGTTAYKDISLRFARKRGNFVFLLR